MKKIASYLFIVTIALSFVACDTGRNVSASKAYSWSSAKESSSKAKSLFHFWKSRHRSHKSDTKTDTGTATATETATETTSYTYTETNTYTNTETESDTTTDTESETETYTESDTQTDADAQISDLAGTYALSTFSMTTQSVTVDQNSPLITSWSGQVTVTADGRVNGTYQFNGIAQTMNFQILAMQDGAIQVNDLAGSCTDWIDFSQNGSTLSLVIADGFCGMTGTSLTFGLEKATETGTDTAAENDSDPSTETETTSGTAAETDTYTDTETQSDVTSETETATETETESDTQADADAQISNMAGTYALSAFSMTSGNFSIDQSSPLITSWSGEITVTADGRVNGTYQFNGTVQTMNFQILEIQDDAIQVNDTAGSCTDWMDFSFDGASLSIVVPDGFCGAEGYSFTLDLDKQ